MSITDRKALQLQLDSCPHRQPVYITPDDSNSLWCYRMILPSTKERVRMGGWVEGCAERRSWTEVKPHRQVIFFSKTIPVAVFLN